MASCASAHAEPRSSTCAGRTSRVALDDPGEACVLRDREGALRPVRYRQKGQRVEGCQHTFESRVIRADDAILPVELEWNLHERAIGPPPVRQLREWAWRLCQHGLMKEHEVKEIRPERRGRVKSHIEEATARGSADQCPKQAHAVGHDVGQMAQQRPGIGSVLFHRHGLHQRPAGRRP